MPIPLSIMKSPLALISSPVLDLLVHLFLSLYLCALDRRIGRQKLPDFSRLTRHRAYKPSKYPSALYHGCYGLSSLTSVVS